MPPALSGYHHHFPAPRVSQGVADFQAKIDSGQIGTSEDTRTGREHVAAAHSAVTENAQELVKSIKA